MDDLSVFRRFFVVSNLLRDVIGMVTGRDLSESGSSSGVPPINPFIQSEAPIQSDQTVGGQSPPIQGRRPAAPRRRRRVAAAPQLPNTARYGFPQPDESV
jgi:hypothetical protein